MSLSDNFPVIFRTGIPPEKQWIFRFPVRPPIGATGTENNPLPEMEAKNGAA
jgi:hypothetical protein